MEVWLLPNPVVVLLLVPNRPGPVPLAVVLLPPKLKPPPVVLPVLPKRFGLFWVWA